MYRIKTLGIGILTTFAVLSCGTLQAGDSSAGLPSIGDLVDEVNQLQESIVGLEDSGFIKHGRSKSLSKKLDKVTKALTSSDSREAAGDVSIQQASFLGELGKAIDALLDFIGELTELITDLPAEVVQPIIDAAIELLQGLLGLLLG